MCLLYVQREFVYSHPCKNFNKFNIYFIDKDMQFIIGAKQITITIIEGISYIFKHNQQSHLCGMVVPEIKLFFIYYFIFVKKNKQTKSLFL